MNPTEALGLPRLQEGLQRLEPLLTASVVTGDGFLDEVTTHLIAAGGKRLRPLLSLATATGGSREATEDDLMGGVAVELVHLASLYHDDVIDEATIRRNVESVNSRFGNLVAIVAGDYLLARSAAIAASLGTEIAALLADTLGRLCQGQVTEVRSAFQIGRSRQDYIDSISGKTAALMATSCRIGALTGGLPTAEVEACTEFGRKFGMVFQVRDDILDITATDGELKKPRDRTWPRASTRCRRSWPWPTPMPDPTSARCSGSRWLSPNGTRPVPSSWARVPSPSRSRVPAPTSPRPRPPPPASSSPNCATGSPGWRRNC